MQLQLSLSPGLHGALSHLAVPLAAARHVAGGAARRAGRSVRLRASVRRLSCARPLHLYHRLRLHHLPGVVPSRDVALLCLVSPWWSLHRATARCVSGAACPRPNPNSTARPPSVLVVFKAHVRAEQPDAFRVVASPPASVYWAALRGTRQLNAPGRLTPLAGMRTLACESSSQVNFKPTLPRSYHAQSFPVTSPLDSVICSLVWLCTRRKTAWATP
jgi:hypothetical protein